MLALASSPLVRFSRPAYDGNGQVRDGACAPGRQVGDLAEMTPIPLTALETHRLP
jgi:hypothetical protein